MHYLPLSVLCGLLGLVSGHGRLWWPPSRSTAWRHGFDTPTNYQDNELFCGGFAYQWGPMGGKCGVCGDPFDGPIENQPGDDNIYAQGVIVDDYEEGAVVDIDIDVTANHYGWFEFRLCVNNDPTQAVTQECLDENLLELADGSGTRYEIQEKENKHFIVPVRLPAGLTCSQCVLQWKYNTGNSWGRDPDTGHECVGCGPQEQFYGCADIAVGEPGVTPPSQGPTQTQPTDVPEATPSAWPTDHPDAICRAIGDWAGDPAMDLWCTVNCTSYPPFCPEETCFCEKPDDK